MKIGWRFLFVKPTPSQVLVSLLIAAGGVVSSHALREIDENLRIMYTDYTLAATGLGHVSADVIRYRATVVRAVEAPTRKDFERISASLPDQRGRILKAVDHFAAATVTVSRNGRNEAPDLQETRNSLAAYFSADDETVALLIRMWQTTSREEAAALRNKAEVHLTDNAGPKLMQVSLALNGLIETVAAVARDLHTEGRRAIRTASAVLLVGCALIVLLILSGQRLPPSPSLEPRSVLREPGQVEPSSFLHSRDEDQAKKFSIRKS